LHYFSEFSSKSTTIPELTCRELYQCCWKRDKAFYGAQSGVSYWPTSFSTIVENIKIDSRIERAGLL
jgi:hypothetical protein